MAKHRRKPDLCLPWLNPEPDAPPVRVELAEVSAPVDEHSLVGELSVVLAQGAPPAAVTATLGLDREIAEAAIKALLALDGVSGLLSLPTPNLAMLPIRNQHRQNLIRRAAYLLSAARRLTTALAAGDLQADLERERTYLRQHVEALANRVVVANRVATEYVKANKLRNTQAGLDMGPTLLGWYAKMDARTSAECRAAHGRNFNPAKIPAIGYPGAVHPACRCEAGPAHKGAPLIDREKFVEPKKVALAAHTGRTQALEVIELVKSAAYPDLERKPGKQNWVDKVGGLPNYIERIAKHLHYEKGMAISHAIAAAVQTVKRWAAGGGEVSAETRAKAAKAVAEWEAKKAASHAD